jgi:transcriptional regulator with XRE-family HTH domain
MSAPLPGPVVLKWYLARELARLRRESGQTLKQVSERLGSSLGHAGHLETGRNLPNRAELEVLLEHYGVGDAAAAYVDMLVAARSQKDWWAPLRGAAPAWFELYLGLERAASAIDIYEPQVVPTLFGTPAYLDAIVGATEPELDGPAAARLAQLHRARQDVLTRDPNPPTVTAILDESVLRGDGPDRETSRTQLGRLLTLSEQRNVTVRLLPVVNRPHAGARGGFTLLSFPNLAGAPSVGYRESAISGTYDQQPEEVARLRTRWDSLHELALDESESRETIEHQLSLR